MTTEPQTEKTTAQKRLDAIVKFAQETAQKRGFEGTIMPVTVFRAIGTCAPLSTSNDITRHAVQVAKNECEPSSGFLLQLHTVEGLINSGAILFDGTRFVKANSPETPYVQSVRGNKVTITLSRRLEA